MKFEKTERGFRRIEFIDRYNNECSIQESSLATEEAMWFGIDKLDPGFKDDGPHRMHLTQNQVKELLPILTYFAMTGLLPDTPDALLPAKEPQAEGRNSIMSLRTRLDLLEDEVKEHRSSLNVYGKRLDMHVDRMDALERMVAKE